MGTTRAYFSIRNRGFTPDELKEKVKALSSFGKQREDAMFKRLGTLLSPEQIEQLRAGAAESTAHFNAVFGGKDRPQVNRAVIAYRPDAKWLPVFEKTLCDGQTASGKEAAQLSKLFQAPVLAFSIFDSDVLFVSYSDVKKGILYDCAKPNCDGFEDYDTDQCSTEFPDFLAEFCDKSALKSIWENPDEVFADDRLDKLCRLMQIDLLDLTFDNTLALDGYQMISAS